MKYIITESTLKNFILKYLNSEYGDLEPFEIERYPEHILFMKDGKLIIDYSKDSSIAYISNDEIWSFLKSMFGLNYEEIEDITKEWMLKDYNLKVVGISNHMLYQSL